MCRVKENKVKYCFYSHTLWSLSIFALVKNPEFSLDIMLLQYSITNMIFSCKEQIKKIEPLARGAAKISASSFNIFIPPTCHIK